MRRTIKAYIALALFVMIGIVPPPVFGDVTVKPISNLNPYFVWDNYPHTPLSRPHEDKKIIFEELDDFVELSQQKYMRYYDSASLLDLGLELTSDHVGLVVLLDLQQDIVTYFEETQWTNIPFIGNNLYAIADMNWTKLGYVDFNFWNVYASVGRRALKWGPASYDFAINDSAPFLDSIYIDINFPVSFGNIWYNYIVTGFNNTSLGYPKNHNGELDEEDLNSKTLFSHKLGWENETWRVSFSELNLIYNKIPSLLDASPLAFWHNNYQHDRSNVMIELAVEKLFLLNPFDFRVYGLFAMDDFVFGSEDVNSKPSAMGFAAGIEFHFLDGDNQQKTVAVRKDYTLREDSFKFSGGLNLSLEWYWATAFLYSRDVDSGKFTVPMWVYNFSDGGYVADKNAFFIGFPYGPDTMVGKILLEYEDDPIKAWFNFELIFKGSYRIDEEYNKENNSKFSSFALNGDVATIIKSDIGCSYAIKDSILLKGQFGLYSDIKNRQTAVSFTIGCSLDLWNLCK